MAFERKITKKIEKFAASQAGQESPAVVDILQDMDAELKALKSPKNPKPLPKQNKRFSSVRGSCCKSGVFEAEGRGCSAE